MTKLNNVRKGDRAEYITQGIFSALGYSLQILRQEDFGIDFLCTLTEKNKIVSYPTRSFTVQLKTNYNNIVISTDRKKYKWLFENYLPFFICVFNDTQNRVDFFSTSLLNHYLIKNPSNAVKISFHLQSGKGYSELNLPSHKQKNKIFKIDLGRPFLSIAINELVKNNIVEERKCIIEKVLKVEYENIVYRNLQLPFMRWLHKYRTNKGKITFGWAHYSDERIINSQNLLENIGNIIISLTHTYKMEKRNDEYNLLKNIVNNLPFNKEYKSSLINLGFRNSRGKIV